MSSPLATKKPTWQSYDDEFSYDLDPQTAAELKAYEEGEIRTKTSSQTKEELQRLYEMNLSSRREYHFPNQDELKKGREGRILHMNTFLTMLKRAGLRCWYSDKGGMAKTLGLYVSHVGTGLKCKHPNGEAHYVCFVQVPFMQEFEELHFDRYDVPLGPKRRGWRTVLLRLIEDGLLSEPNAHKIFGDPSSGIQSRRYRQYLHYVRNLPK